MSGTLIPRDRTAHPEPYDPGYKTSVVRSPRYALLSLDATVEAMEEATATALTGG